MVEQYSGSMCVYSLHEAFRLTVWLFAQNLLSLHKNPQTQKLIYKLRSSASEGYTLCSYLYVDVQDLHICVQRHLWTVLLLLAE